MPNFKTEITAFYQFKEIQIEFPREKIELIGAKKLDELKCHESKIQ